MKRTLCLIALSCLANTIIAQYVYTIKADSVKVTNCDSSELIIENHTQNVPGFLFNTGNGRTVFKRGAQRLNDSSYLIGADTLKLKTNAWIQGGNAFGTIGMLGTNDNNSLDLYTNGAQRVRLTNTGNLLLGTTTDNGNLLQVNGNTSIGSATITSTGNLIGTNAILFNHFIPRYHNYHTSSPFISRLDDVLYNYDTRLHTTYTQATDGTWTIDIVFPPDEIGTQGIVYSSGNMYFSFWANGLPGSISVMAKNYSGGWAGPYTTDSSYNLNYGSGLYQVPIGLSNWLTELKITISPLSGGFVNLQDMAYVLGVDNEGLTNPYPYVSKYGNEHIYNYFYLKNGGVDNVRISPFLSVPNYFLNPMLIGSSTVNGSAILQVTGDVTATGNMGIGTASPGAQLHTTGTVRFGGLTSDNTQTRVLVSDANGNLYYRDASTLAGNGILNTDLADGKVILPSLAVNGTVTAQRLKLSQAGWPDYVFGQGYRLPQLNETEEYIRQHGHLPGIPSAAEVEKKGIDVGDHQVALLKKIEELTLYNIAQEKELQDQNKRLEMQATELSALKQAMAELKKMVTNRSLNR